MRASETCGVAPFLPLFGLMTHTKTSVPSLSGLSAPVPRAALWESPVASGSLACSLQGLEAQAAPVFLEQFLKAEPMLEDSLVQGAGGHDPQGKPGLTDCLLEQLVSTDCV